MRCFREALAARSGAPGASARRWIYVPYDQLTDAVGPLSADPRGLGAILIESPEKAGRRPYHRQKLALILANQRHFALEQAERGVAIRYEVTAGGYREALEALATELGPIEVMRPAERELRVELAPLLRSGALLERPNALWLTDVDDFAAIAGPPWRMDAFYRRVRRRTGLLMDEGKPEGGRFSFDGENRLPWRGEPALPTPPRFTPDPITAEVGALIERRYSSHPGQLDLSALPTTRADAEALWAWAKRDCMPHFGPYEDAMTRRSTGLFHTRISPLLNIGRLRPERIVTEAAALNLPLASREGFVRQILGWREFVRHVHEATDGLRTQPGGANHLDARAPLPPAWWGDAPSGMDCLDDVVAGVWREGWSHHITRLMVLSNLATLLGVEPRALSDWFWVAYVDAFDWVVEPNVLGMGTFAAGPLMTTKPYVSGSGYIHRMSDYCKACAFHPKRTCPITPLYWDFLARHEARLADNLRMKLPLKGLARRSPSQRDADRAVADAARRRLAEGRPITPADVEAAWAAARPGEDAD